MSSPVLNHVASGKAEHFGIVSHGELGHNVDVTPINVEHGLEDGRKESELVQLLHPVLNLGAKHPVEKLHQSVFSHRVGNERGLIRQDPGHNEVIHKEQF